jgi:hypothetical protein
MHINDLKLSNCRQFLALHYLFRLLVTGEDDDDDDADVSASFFLLTDVLL